MNEKEAKKARAKTKAQAEKTPRKSTKTQKSGDLREFQEALAAVSQSIQAGKIQAPWWREKP